MTIYEAVKSSIAFIEDHLRQDICVLDVANSVCYSQFYLSREFSRCAKISIYDYIIRRKISESYKELFETKTRITDLAFQYGFQSHEVYTRAFRKIVGENPSEASIYKPFAVFEAIDEEYLVSLQKLQTDMAEEIIPECFFEINGICAAEDVPSHILILDKAHLLGSKGTLQGYLKYSEPEQLHIKLCNLQRKIRIYCGDWQHSLRYFLNNIYYAGEMKSNYILLLKNENSTDYYISPKN